MPRSGVSDRLETVTFAELIRSKYSAAGISQARWMAIVTVETGVGRGSQHAAFKGMRVKPETARALMIWAARVHHVDLDELALMHAPTKAPRKTRSQPAQAVPC